MQPLKNLLLFFFLVFSFSNLFSQDSLIFLNGRTATGKVIDTTGFTVKYLDVDHKGQKVRTVEKQRLFSINYPKKEVVLYTPDTLGENDLSVDEMRYFIYGAQDALNYKAPFAFAGGVATGMIAGPFVGPTAGLALLLPGAYSIISGSRWINVKQESVRNIELVKQKPYLYGYERTARSKIVQSSLKGSGIGLVLGLGVATIILLTR